MVRTSPVASPFQLISPVPFVGIRYPVTSTYDDVWRLPVSMKPVIHSTWNHMVPPLCSGPVQKIEMVTGTPIPPLAL